jgi:uncharacterized protein
MGKPMTDTATPHTYPATPPTYPATPLTTTTRYPHRATYDRAAIHELLDSQFFGHVGFVVDGAPRVLPTLFVRVGEVIYLHGSPAATWLLQARRDESVRTVVSVATVDGLVLARAQKHHSVNYRSVVVHGSPVLVTDAAEKRAAMAALIEKIGTGRTAGSKPPSATDLAGVAVLRLDLELVSMKQRTGGPIDDAEDLDLPYWAGEIPLVVQREPGRSAAGVTAPTPAYVPARSAWFTPPTLPGRHVTIEPLTSEHSAELFTALDDEEVWAYIPRIRPRSVADLDTIVADAIADPLRVPMVQRLTATGQIVGTTSFYDVNEAFGSIAIGYTQIGRPWWRTAVNTEAKLLLMTHVFETLGAERLVWHTDIRNNRSQAAIERLGASREGVLRHQRLRPDGTWRDTVQYSMISDEWPSARARLEAWAGRGSERHTG